MTLKPCDTCGQAKPLSEYYYHANHGKFMTKCKECHCMRNNELRRGKRRSSKVEQAILIPDCHIPYHDIKGFDLMLRTIQSEQPDHVIILGDFLDCYSVSFFDKSPRRKAFMQEELDAGREALERIRAACPESNIVYIEGNHEVRMERYITRNAPALDGLIDIYEYLGLKDLDIEFVAYKSSYSLGKLRVTHDLGSSGKYAHVKVTDEGGDNYAIGHVHRAGVSYSGTVGGDMHVGIACGWLGDFDKVDYKHRDRAKREWMHGFGWVYLLPNGNIWVTFVPIVEGQVVVGGKVYE